MVKKEDIPILDQLIGSLEETASKLEEAFERKDFESFVKAKKFMIQIQKKIAEVIK